MASSRRAQVRSLLAARSGVLVDRAESYLAAVDVWAGQGNAKAVQRVGPGLVAVCCWLASESLDSPQLTRSAAERASGLTPIQFRNAERDLRVAVSGVGQSSHQASNAAPSTPSRRSSSALSTPSRRSASGSATSTPSKRKLDEVGGFDPSDRSPEALRARAQAAQSGSLFARAPSNDPAASTVSTPRNPRFKDLFQGNILHTPTKSSPLKQVRHEDAGAAADDDGTTPRAARSQLDFDAANHDRVRTYNVDLADPVPHQSTAQTARARRLRSMRHLVRRVHSATATSSSDRTDVQEKVELLKQRLAPLLSSSLEESGLGERWDQYGAEGDLFVCLPLGRLAQGS